MFNHLLYDNALSKDSVGRHPLDTMEYLGITYAKAVCCPMGYYWHFWCCEYNGPLPRFLSVMHVDPLDFIGLGLNEKDAKFLHEMEKNHE